jgi:hypothetical protein
MSRDGAVGIETGQPSIGRGQDFSPLHVVQTGSEAYPIPPPPSNEYGEAHTQGVKRPESEAHHSLPTSAEVRNT